MRFWKTWVLVFWMGMAGAGVAEPALRTNQWREVEAALEKGLPRTALQSLPGLERDALQEKAWGEAARAIALRIQLEAVAGGNPFEARIRQLGAALPALSPEVRPVLQALEAHWYRSYLLQNRWRLMQRSATSTAQGEDFTTWDLRRLADEVSRQFAAALVSPEPLQQTPIAVFDGILEKGTVSDAHRPTLYDFLVFEALSFYTSPEQVAARPEEAIELRADEPVYGVVPLFGSAEEFARTVKIERRVEESPAEKALFLYRDLLRFHLADRDPTALIDADIARLRWVRAVAVGEDVPGKYRAAMESLARRHAAHELSSMAWLHVAEDLQAAEDLVGARAAALRGREAHPDSPGGKLCANVVTGIESPESQVSVDRVWTASRGSWPVIAVRSRNLRQIWFRAVAVDWTGPQVELGWEGRFNIASILKRPPALEWSQAITPGTNYQLQTARFPAPRNLARGWYRILACHDPAFATNRSPVSAGSIWVSDLAMVTRTRVGDLEGLTLQAATGEPLAGVTIEAWQETPDHRFTVAARSQSDALGQFRFANQDQRRFFALRAVFNSDVLVESMVEPGWWEKPPESHESTMLFTDRALYRPGQIIQYKGIRVRVDTEADDYATVAGRDVTVVLRDVNNQEVERHTHRSNAYGSFSGSFTAPRGRALGAMRIVVEGQKGEGAEFSVEEYKRPRFHVAFEPLAAGAVLDGPVSATGTALSYTGAPVDAATVSWRVVRYARFPEWGERSRPSLWSESQQIAHGRTVTGADGRFQVEFTARADHAVPAAEDPVFEFTVFAKVTDAAGETRTTEKVVRVGYRSLELAARADAWQTTSKPVSLVISAQSLDGRPLAAEGKVTVYRVLQPSSIRRDAGFGDDDAGNSGVIHSTIPSSWPLGAIVMEQRFKAGSMGEATNAFSLPAGVYRGRVEAADASGRLVQSWTQIQVLDEQADRLGIKVPFLIEARRWEANPGEEFQVIWGTGYDAGRAFIEVEHRNRIVDHYWTQAGRTQQRLQVPVVETMRGGFTVHVTQVIENRLYQQAIHVDVPWTSKQLDLHWDHLTSRLQPGATETWSLVITSSVPLVTTGQAANAAELLAVLYDSSLDAFRLPNWPDHFTFFRRDGTSGNTAFANRGEPFFETLGNWPARDRWPVNVEYRRYAYGLASGEVGHGPRRLFKAVHEPGAAALRTSPAVAVPDMAPATMGEDGYPLMGAGSAMAGSLAPQRAPEPPRSTDPDTTRVVPRRLLQETAFFLPHVTADDKGVFRLTFTVPEGLTTWRFMAFAHDRQARSGSLGATAITSRPLMVLPNAPRFLREGDRLEFTTRILNQSTGAITGRIRLEFRRAEDGANADGVVGNSRPELEFAVPAGGSTAIAWPLVVSDHAGAIQYRVVAAGAGGLSDGEEGWLPILPRRVPVTESLALSVRGAGEHHFQFPALSRIKDSPTLVPQGLTVQVASRPAWYAVLALPYLMEFPYECSEQTFNRLYANALARHIARSDPAIRSVFDQWRGTAALDSPLEKNEELKSVLLDETPWVREAKSESAARRNLGVLFDTSRLDAETAAALGRLQQLQLADGGWSWFPGGFADEYMTRYIVCGFGRLRHLGAEVPVDAAIKALRFLDQGVFQEHEQLRKSGHLGDTNLSPAIALYLYGRSYFLEDLPVASEHQAAVTYWLDQARTHWLRLPGRMSQGHAALALARWGDKAAALGIARSLRERAVVDPAMGMSWPGEGGEFLWYHAPIEAQALMIELFDEVAADAQAVEECRLWLLQQKRTQDWRTTRATADAVYGLLLRGPRLLGGGGRISVELGGRGVLDSDPASGQGGRQPSEPGTGFTEQRVAGDSIVPAMADVVVRKSDPGIAWGGLHWRYLEDIGRVRRADGGPLSVRKSLWVRGNTPHGPELRPVTGPVAVGDELVVRLEVQADRDLDYVHLKDPRGSGVEPVDVLSAYSFREGVSAYRMTRDTATHYFIDHLRRGTYVFEHASRVQLRGTYPAGAAEVQCLYAPEFSGHSDGLMLEAR